MIPDIARALKPRKNSSNGSLTKGASMPNHDVQGRPHHWLSFLLAWLVALATLPMALSAEEGKEAGKLEWIRVGRDGRGFIGAESQAEFRPRGFNYDHDASGKLLEDYWTTDWPRVVEDFAEMKALGANVVRVHLQFGKFMDAADRPRAAALEQLTKLLQLAEQRQLYLDLTGLGCYHKADVPAWYDALDETARWQAQTVFWRAIAKTCAASAAVFCYDLMNEPVAPAGNKPHEDWLGPEFGGKHFVQFISRDRAGRARHEIARAWIKQLVAAVREHDQRHLITVGLVPWSLDRPGLTSGFVPKEIVGELDFIAVHLYPASGKLEEDLETLRGFAVGKPVVIEEIFPLKCRAEELAEFLDASDAIAAGYIGFYWGRTREEYAKGTTIGDAITLAWLELFASRAQAAQR